MDEIMQAIEKQQAAIESLAAAAREGGKRGWGKSLELWQGLVGVGVVLVGLIVWGARLPGPVEIEKIEAQLRSQSERIARLEEAAARSADRARMVTALDEKLDNFKQTLEDTRRDVAVLRARSEKGK